MTSRAETRRRATARIPQASHNALCNGGGSTAGDRAKCRPFPPIPRATRQPPFVSVWPGSTPSASTGTRNRGGGSTLSPPGLPWGGPVRSSRSKGFRFQPSIQETWGPVANRVFPHAQTFSIVRGPGRLARFDAAGAVSGPLSAPWAPTVVCAYQPSGRATSGTGRGSGLRLREGPASAPGTAGGLRVRGGRAGE